MQRLWHPLVLVQLQLVLIVVDASIRHYPVLTLLPELALMSTHTHEANVSQASFLEHFSRTKYHEHDNAEFVRVRRQVIAGQMYDWHSYEIPFSIWGGDCTFLWRDAVGKSSAKIQTISRISSGAACACGKRKLVCDLSKMRRRATQSDMCSIKAIGNQ
jgi:hypothetical protein